MEMETDRDRDGQIDTHTHTHTHTHTQSYHDVLSENKSMINIGETQPVKLEKEEFCFF